MASKPVSFMALPPRLWTGVCPQLQGGNASRVPGEIPSGRACDSMKVRSGARRGADSPRRRGPTRMRRAHMKTAVRRLGLLGVLALSLTPVLLTRAAQGTFKTEYYKGKVVPLASVLAKHGAKLDADAAPHWLALVGDD